MSHLAFGTGVLTARATDANGTVTGTPSQFGVLQGVSIDISASNKELMGQYNFPVAVARGASKISGKASAAHLDGRLFNELFFGGTLATGTDRRLITDEAGSIPGATTYTITVANAATFRRDYGVKLVSTGVQMIRVASAPATGQYSVNETTGVYTFAAANASAAVLISYECAPTQADAEVVTINQQLLGVAPRFQMSLATQYDGRIMTLTLNACVSNKLSFATKQEDFVIPEFEFSAFADNSGVVGTMATRRV